MRLTWKDAVGTALFALIVVPYGFYLAWGGISLVQDSSGATTVGILDPTGMAGYALFLGIIAAAVDGWVTVRATAAGYFTIALGVVSGGLGILALAGENVFGSTVWAGVSIWEGVLAAFVATIVLLWGIATARHSGLVGGGAPHARPGMTPA